MPHRRRGGRNVGRIRAVLVRCEPRYLSAFAERGVTPDLNLIRECGEWTSAEGARRYVRCMRRAFNRDGVFALNDLLAMGAVSVSCGKCACECRKACAMVELR